MLENLLVQEVNVKVEVFIVLEVFRNFLVWDELGVHCQHVDRKLLVGGLRFLINFFALILLQKQFEKIIINSSILVVPLKTLLG